MYRNKYISIALSTPPLEELPQQGRRLALADAAIDLGSVVAGRLVEEAHAVLHRSALGVVGGEIDPPDAREGDRGRAHGAGLQGHVEIAVAEPLVVQNFAGAADGQHLRMGG